MHAAAQVASITIDHPIPCDELLRALNARLKAGDIRIRSIEEMPDRWDARIFARGKTYRYAIWNGAHAKPVPPARGLARARSRSISIACSVRRRALLGEHDFVAFQGRGTDVKTTVRRVIAADIVEMNIHTDQPIALSPLDRGEMDADDCFASRSAAPVFSATWCGRSPGRSPTLAAATWSRMSCAGSSRRRIDRGRDKRRRLTG